MQHPAHQPQARAHSRRIWTTLICASLAMFVLGAIYAYGVLLPALMEEFSWERSTAALPHAVLLFVYSVGMFVGGLLQDRTSPTGIAVTGGVLFGLGVLLASEARSLVLFILAYGVLGGIGFGFAYVSAVTASMKALPDRRGLAAGMVVGAFGLGAFVWAPLAQHFLPELGWHGVLLRFGVLTIIALGLLSLGIRSPWHPHDVPGAHPEAQGVTTAHALRTGLFWTLFAAYLLVTAVGLMLLSHMVNIGTARGMTATQAAWILSTMSVGSGAGRIIMGWLSDRLGRLPSLVGASILEILVLVLLVNTTAPAEIYLLAGLAGFAFGTWLSLYGPTSTDLFGLRSAGAIYGALYLSYGIGGLIGPTLGGHLADRTGSYALTFYVSMGLCAAAALLFGLAMRMHPPHYPHPPALEEEFPV